MAYRVVIVGAGLAGLRSAEALRRLGFAGSIMLIGEEIHLPYDRPPLSKEFLRGEGTTPWLRQADKYHELDVHIRLGTSAIRVHTADHALTLGDGSTVSYGSLIVATGATPRRLAGTERIEDTFTLRTLEDATLVAASIKNHGRVAVLGAGFIGCEVAASARALGASVTMIEMLSAPLVRQLGEAPAAEVAALHESHGVELICNVRVKEVFAEPARDGKPPIRGVALDDGQILPPSAVVMGLGVTPNVALLELSGIEVDDGVVCDEYGQTSAADVYAVGDVARWRHPIGPRHERYEHWTSAADQALTVAKNIIRQSPQYANNTVPYFWSDQYNIRLQSLGWLSARADIDVVRIQPQNRSLYIYSEGGRVTAVLGFGVPRVVTSLRATVADGAPVAEALRTASS